MSRIEAAALAWDHYWGDRYGDEAVEEMGEEVKVALAAADAHDLAHGVHRIVLDDATVERAARGLARHKWPTAMGLWESFGQGMRDDFKDAALAVLSAAVQEERA